MSISPQANSSPTATNGEAGAPFNSLALSEIAQQAARIGGATLMHWLDRFETHEKGPADLVTDADIHAQQAIQATILGVRPEDRFVGEESPREGNTVAPPPNDGRVTWVVDPLDGTTNYVHGFPCYATSIGAVVDGVVLAGAIFDPLRNEMFHVARGHGAFVGDRPLHVSSCERLSEALVAVSLPPDVSPESPDLADFIAVVTRSRAIRRTGSAALNLAYVAAGRLDSHWSHQIFPWDAAAGTLLVEEAGGLVTGSRGEPYDLWRAHYLVAGTEALHTEVTQVIGKACKA